MTKEIIVNAGELESRVAVLENGRLMELHVEREPKIVGNIYKGRVTKVLKGMDAAFVDIGIERNAFLAASDVIPEGEEENGHGRSSRSGAPPINQLLHANQEILVQVVRAPLGTKGARVTTRLSIPGRYMVLMLNSGSHVGVSRKIEEGKERARLRTLANDLRPEAYSLIVRTEAEDKSEEELRGDIAFLTDMAKRIETKAATSPAPSLIHGDLTLIFRLIRDAFTRDINRLVVDSPTTYENVLELIGMIAPRMKNRVFLYDDAMPIFHAYNIEPEIERTLRRKVWLPSGGSLVIDQAEALTAIDVNTGRFVGSVELAETVLTTNLQAADEVARQLRLRDLGGIIVVDFIDMDNPKHRQQVMAAFDDALHRDRAKLKVHTISPLGLVEMTRKRTGDSLGRLLTEPCPYCSGIGRVQNSLTMALRIEREIAATAVEHVDTEAYLLSAHPRIIASMLGYEGEAHRDLEAYLERPVYLRSADDFHPNAYQLERLTLEQALVAVKTVEEGAVVEGQVVNPDPEVSLSPLVQVNGIYIIVPDLDAPVGARVKVRVTDVGTSLAIAEPLAEELRGIHVEETPLALQRPPLVPEAVLPQYLREERATVPPHGMQLLSPTAEAVPAPLSLPAIDEEPSSREDDGSSISRRRKRGGRGRKRGQELLQDTDATPLVEADVSSGEAGDDESLPLVEDRIPDGTEEDGTSDTLASSTSSRRRRRRRRGRGTAAPAPEITSDGAEAVLDVAPESELAEAPTGELPVEVIEEPVIVTHTRRRRSGRRRRSEAPALSVDPMLLTVPTVPEPILQEISAEEANEAMLGILNAIASPESAGEAHHAETAAASEADAIAEPISAAPVEATPSRRPPRRRSRRTSETTAAPSLSQATSLPISSTAPELDEIAKPADVEETPDTREPIAPTPTDDAPAEKPKRRRRATPPAEGGNTPAPRRRTRRTTTANDSPTTEPIPEE